MMLIVGIGTQLGFSQDRLECLNVFYFDILPDLKVRGFQKSLSGVPLSVSRLT
jgi:hypothetical protein